MFLLPLALGPWPFGPWAWVIGPWSFGPWSLVLGPWLLLSIGGTLWMRPKRGPIPQGFGVWSFVFVFAAAWLGFLLVGCGFG